MLTFGALARNTLWMIIGQGVRMLVQFAYFVLIVRILHKDGYGAFSGVVALVSVFFPFSGWGTGNLLIKHVARQTGSFPVYWGRALVTVGVSGAVLTLLILVLASFILPPAVPRMIVLWVAVADLLFTRVLEVSSQAFQAHQRLRETAVLSVLFSAGKLCAVLLLIYVGTTDALLSWALLYLGSSVVIAGMGFVWVSMEFGLPRWEVAGWGAEFSEGFYFATSVSAQRVYIDSDKTLLTRLASLESAGIYAAAARLIDVVFVPVTALLAAAYARFFMQGHAGLRGALALTYKLLPPALVYTAVVAMCMYLFAPLIPWLLGDEFIDTVAAARWLALVPLLMTLHRFAADSLTGAGHQRVRTACEFLAALLNVLVNLVLIPAFGWRGAAASTLGTEMVLILTLWGVVWWICRSQPSDAAVTGA